MRKTKAEGEFYWARSFTHPRHSYGQDAVPIVEVAAKLEVSQTTVSRRVRYDRIHGGELAGTSTAENTELFAAQHRIAELEGELAR